MGPAYPDIEAKDTTGGGEKKTKKTQNYKPIFFMNIGAKNPQ